VRSEKSRTSKCENSVKRSYHVEDVKDFLKDIYMPPTPISSIDDDSPDPKKARLCDSTTPDTTSIVQSVISDISSSQKSEDKCFDSSPLDGSTYSEVTRLIPESRWFYSDRDKTLSCGQTSMFGELQSVVYHSLMTSLES